MAEMGWDAQVTKVEPARYQVKVEKEGIVLLPQKKLWTSWLGKTHARGLHNHFSKEEILGYMILVGFSNFRSVVVVVVLCVCYLICSRCINGKCVGMY